MRVELEYDGATEDPVDFILRDPYYADETEQSLVILGYEHDRERKGDKYVPIR